MFSPWIKNSRRVRYISQFNIYSADNSLDDITLHFALQNPGCDPNGALSVNHYASLFSGCILTKILYRCFSSGNQTVITTRQYRQRGIIVQLPAVQRDFDVHPNIHNDNGAHNNSDKVKLTTHIHLVPKLKVTDWIS
jgi:hypothetical protein